jgi:hypothetical protein
MEFFFQQKFYLFFHKKKKKLGKLLCFRWVKILTNFSKILGIFLPNIQHQKIEKEPASLDPLSANFLNFDIGPNFY